MLNVFAMFDDQGWAELRELLPQLWDDLFADKVFHWLFGTCVGIDIYIKLSWMLVGSCKAPKGDDETYNVLIFFRIVGDFRNCDGTANIVIVLGFTCNSQCPL